VLDPGSQTFEPVNVGDLRRSLFSGPFILSRRQQTIVVAGGSALVVQEGFLTPWLSPQKIDLLGLGGIAALHDAPSLGATVLLDAPPKAKEANLRVQVLTDNDTLHHLASLPAGDFGSEVFSIRGLRIAVLFTSKSAIVIRDNGINTSPRFSTEALPTPTRGPSKDVIYHPSTLLGQLLTVVSGRRWAHLTAHGFEDIPGGDIGVISRLPGGRIQDLPTLGRTLISGRDGLFLYDGARITPVPESGSARLGDYPRVYDLPSIGRVMVSTPKGIFELDRQGRLLPQPVPFTLEGLTSPEFADWPPAGVALVLTGDGVFAIDKELNASLVTGGDQVESGDGRIQGIDTATGDVILAGKRGLFLAVDGRSSGSHACSVQREIEKRIADSDICIRPVPGSDARTIGFAVGGIVEAPRGDGLLFESVRGLFHQSTDGRIASLQSKSGQYMRSMTTLPWSDEVLVAAATIVRRDLSLQFLPSSQYSDHISAFESSRFALVVPGLDTGPVKLVRSERGRHEIIGTSLRSSDVRVVAEAPWFGGVIIGNWHGRLAVLDRDGQLAWLDLHDPDQSDKQTRSSFRDQFHTAGQLVSIARFRSVYALSTGGWFRITDERHRLPVAGLPRDARIQATFDPGRGDVLLATTAGLFAVAASGEVRRLGDSTSWVTMRALAREVGSDDILAGGAGGLFRIKQASLDVEPVTNGSDDMIGAVNRILEVPFAGAVIVEASNGTYALEDGKLTNIRDLAAASQLSNVYVFPRLRRIIAKSAYNGPLLHEAARRDATGACTRPIAVR
jgi:hypothetical protein